MQPSPGYQRRAAIVLALLGLALAVTVLRPKRPTTKALLTQGTASLARGDFAAAERLSQQVLNQSPQSSRALCLAGQAAAGLQRYPEALDYFRQMPHGSEALPAEAYGEAARVALLLGRAAEAEAFLRQALEQDPDDVAANNQLAYLLGVQGRCFEATAHLLRVVRQGQATLHHLVLLGATEPVIADPALVDRCLAAVPADPLPLLGGARTAIVEHNLERARQLLQEIVGIAPTQIEAQARLGTIWLETSPDQFLRWHASLPAAADRHPEIWSVRGLRAQQDRQPEVAMRCFWEAVRLDPNHRGALYHLGQLLQAAGDTTLAQRFLERAASLQTLAAVLDQAYDRPDDTHRIQTAATLTEELGRLSEAWAWSRLALHTRPNTPWARVTVARLEKRLPRDAATRTEPSLNPALWADLSHYPLPAWNVPSSSLAGPADAQLPAVAFTDDAAAAGIDFVFYNGQDLQGVTTRMVETIGGGGVGVVDFDLDGWPDLYFTQGGPWPPDPGQTRYLNRLFRNLGNGQFQDVTRLAAVGDNGYGQGIAVGDYDNDGFPDLYVAKIGANRLYRNNGDGTFRDVTTPSGIGSERWTASCLIADLNGDGLPDLYDVNYLSAREAPGTRCPPGREDELCSPAAFPAEQDQVWLNLGDGRFQDVTETAGIVCPAGKGLGIVAGDFDDSGRLSLFVANDGVPNFFFRNQTPQAGADLRFAEQGLLSGLSLDGDGRPRGSMGVAAGDVNGDGLLDLFVATFYDQANVLYIQQPDHSFSDATSEFQLHNPTLRKLGFGTKFLDADLDGWPDLVVTNGHIFDRSSQGIPYRMRPQYFHNLDGRQFRELPSESLGAFFQRERLGRGLARLDWNRDGREDFVVSHMHEPASLLTNRTPHAGHFLVVQLRGTSGARDAIGAKVMLQAGSRTWTQQLTAGDGYQASNQRQLVFGLGRQSQIDKLAVRWPSGQVQECPRPPCDTELLVIEGGLCLPRPPP